MATLLFWQTIAAARHSTASTIIKQCAYMRRSISMDMSLYAQKSQFLQQSDCVVFCL